MKPSIPGLLLCLILLFFCGCAAPSPEPTRTAPPTPPQIASASPETAPAPTAETLSPEPSAAAPATIETVPPTAEPEPDPLEAILMDMTLEEKAAQMLVLTPEALTGRDSYQTRADDGLRAAYDRLPAGGFLLLGGNLKDPAQTKALLAELQSMSRARTGLPLLLCVDEEGGPVARISGKAAFGVPKIPAMSTVKDAGTARDLGRTIGTYLGELGFNLDLAPCADVLTNPANRVVRDRSFGSDPETVTELAGALAEGLTEGGVLPCWKHFPGHGGTAEDSHKGFAVLHLDPDAPEASPELQPFLAAAEQGAPMIMTGHITVPELDQELPASLSPTLLSLLRGPERRYDGLLITDALGMGAITDRFGPGEAAVLAVLAGNDLLLAPDDPEAALRAIVAAVRDGVIPEERINESVYRILRTKTDLP